MYSCMHNCVTAMLEQCHSCMHSCDIVFFILILFLDLLRDFLLQSIRFFFLEQMISNIHV